MTRLWSLQGCTVRCHTDHTFSWSIHGIEWRYVPDQGGGSVLWRQAGSEWGEEPKVPTVDAAVAFSRGFGAAWGCYEGRHLRGGDNPTGGPTT